MAGKRKGGGAGRPPIKGFRPGKAPAHLKKQQARAQLGSEATWVQKQTVEAVAGRTPQQVRSMVRKWSLLLLGTAFVLGVVGVFLYGWATWAGVVAHVLTALLVFLGYRVRKQSTVLEEMAQTLR